MRVALSDQNCCGNPRKQTLTAALPTVSSGFYLQPCFSMSKLEIETGLAGQRRMFLCNISSKTCEDEARKDAAIDAAFEAFAENGYARTRVDDVAKRAGVSKGLA